MRYLKVVILVVLLFFLVGGVFSYFYESYTGIYILISSLLGSFASILGLLSLGGQRKADLDLHEIDAKMLTKVAEAAELVKKYEEKITEGKKEVVEIEKMRIQIEKIIREATLKAHLEERTKALLEEIEKTIKRDQYLSDLIEDYVIANNKLSSISQRVDQFDSNYIKIIENITEMNLNRNKLINESVFLRYKDQPPLYRFLNTLIDGLFEGILRTRR